MEAGVGQPHLGAQLAWFRCLLIDLRGHDGRIWSWRVAIFSASLELGFWNEFVRDAFGEGKTGGGNQLKGSSRIQTKGGKNGKRGMLNGMERCQGWWWGDEGRRLWAPGEGPVEGLGGTVRVEILEERKWGPREDALPSYLLAVTRQVERGRLLWVLGWCLELVWKLSQGPSFAAGTRPGTGVSLAPLLLAFSAKCGW